MSTKYFVHIVAVDENNAIGYKDQLLFRISEDLKRFKRLTQHHAVIAGTKTINTLPFLKDRKLIQLSRTPGHVDGNPKICTRITKIEEAIQPWSQPGNVKEPIFIIGGGEVYASTLNDVSVIVLTQIHAKAEKADAWYPNYSSIRPPKYCTESVRHTDPASGVEYSYVILGYNSEDLKHFLKYKHKRDKEYEAESKAKNTVVRNTKL